MPPDRDLRPAKVALRVPAFSVLAFVGLAAPGCPCCAARLPCAGQMRRAPAAQSEFFENKIRPIFVNNCYKCHSRQAEKLKGNLSLESREGLLKGGENGPAIVPGDPDHSLLIKAVRYTDPDLQMPPKGQKLSDAANRRPGSLGQDGRARSRAARARAGGELEQKPPRTLGLSARQEPWPIPEVADTNWVPTPVDAFILAKLEATA